MQQTSRGKFDRLQRTTAGFTDTRLDGYGLRCSLPTRPRVLASYPILVHRHTPLLHASFRPRLATTPLRFANPSPPSGWIRDLHPQTFEHARHTMKRLAGNGEPFFYYCYQHSRVGDINTKLFKKSLHFVLYELRRFRQDVLLTGFPQGPRRGLSRG